MSMTELLMTTALVGILGLVVSSLMVQMTREAAGITDRMSFEEEFELLQSVIERPYRTAVDVRLASTAAAPLVANRVLNDGASRGALTVYDSVARPNDGNADLIALFFRESSFMNAGVRLTSALTPTAIYFQRPTTTTYGMLYISNGAQGAAGSLQPSGAAVNFGRITEFRIQNPIPNTVNSYTKNFEVSVTMRYPVGAASQDTGTLNNVNWCPAPDIADSTCVGANTRNYKDVNRVFKVELKNNGNPAGPDFSDLLYGRIYFLH